MPSARTHCPQCNSPDVVDLVDLLYSRNVDFFRCPQCSGWWSVPKGADEPATLGVLSDPAPSALRNVAVQAGFDAVSESGRRNG
jgi:hypothetical protein